MYTNTNIEKMKMRQPFIDPSSSQHCTLTSLQGLSMASMKRHFGLAPLAVIMSAGMAFVTAYIIRLSTKTTDIQARTNTTFLSNMSIILCTYLLKLQHAPKNIRSPPHLLTQLQN